MASGDREGGGPSKPQPDGAAAAEAAAEEDERPLEISSRGRIVVRSSSHPPGETPPYSEPPLVITVTPPSGREKRDTPAERPRGRRAARALSTSADEVSPSQPPSAATHGNAVLWAIIAVLSAALAWALLR